MLPEIPGYDVERELGRGGMGVVYKCHHRERGVPLAVKMMLCGRGATFEELARFRVEAEAYSCLKHPNIIKIRDVGVANRCPYFATEYAANGSLSDYLRSQPKSMDWCVNAIREVALALDHAHGRRILHRDLKPANILVMDDESPKVTDFGLVKFAAPIASVNQACCTFSVSELDQELMRFARELRHDYPDSQAGSHDLAGLVTTLRHTCIKRTGLAPGDLDETEILDFLTAFAKRAPSQGAPVLEELDGLSMDGQVMGSPQFMSPEQASGELAKIGPATDVYGLGATLYQMLTQHPPFTAKPFGDVLTAVRTEMPVTAQAVCPEVSTELDAVIWKCLQKDPVDRYLDAVSLAEDLDRCLEGRKPLALLKRGSRKEAEPQSKGGFRDLTTVFARAFPKKKN